MLSLDDIKNAGFRKANFGGYKPEDVDSFIDDVQLSYSQLLRENKNLKSEVDKLRAKLDKYHEEDDLIRNVLLKARGVADSALSDAENKTKEMISNAKATSDKMIQDAKREVDFQAEISAKLRKESADLRNKLEEIYKKHMDVINQIPSSMEDNFVGTASSEKAGRENEYQDIVSNDVVSEKSDIEVDLFDAVINPTPDLDSVENGLSRNVNGKFRNLKFGENYSSESDSDGVYGGIFKK